MTDAVVLLAGAISYALGAVPTGDLSRPTPCADWDLGTLLQHLAESMSTLNEALTCGNLSINPATSVPAGPATASGPVPDPVDVLRDRAGELLWAAFAVADTPIAVEGIPVPRGVIIAAGTVEIAVHGWDVRAACGAQVPVPAELAGPLIRQLPQLIDVREGLFGPPVPVPPLACPGARLVAYLGRDPGRQHWLLTSSIGVSST